MALAAATKLGPYEVLAPVGEGGMGEVYRARDTRLNRSVAIKVLPQTIAADTDRMHRFEQEARSIAALNHPTFWRSMTSEYRTVLRTWSWSCWREKLFASG